MDLPFQNANLNITYKIEFWKKQKFYQVGWPSKWEGPFSGTAKKNNSLIREKISDHMEPSQLAFIIPSQPGKWAGPSPYNCNPGGLAH